MIAEFVDAATLQIDRAQVLLDAVLPDHGAELSVIHEVPSNSIMLGTGDERGAAAMLHAGASTSPGSGSSSGTAGTRIMPCWQWRRAGSRSSSRPTGSRSSASSSRTP
jgi:hypothetical protein